MSEEPFAPCPPGCEIPADIHRHYQRDLGVGNYFAQARPTECCGREYARPDEVFFLGQCEWCRQDGKPMPGAITYVRVGQAVRDAPRRRRR